jgi:hypothetical protein
MSAQTRLASSTFSQRGTTSIWERVLELKNDRELLAVGLFSALGLLVSLWLALAYAIPAANDLVELAW